MPSSPPERKPRPADQEGKHARAIAQYSSLVVVMPLCVFSGYLFGAWLDGMFATDGLLAVVFLLLGAVAGFHQMYRIVTRTTK